MEPELKELLDNILRNIPSDIDVSTMEGTLYGVDRNLDQQNKLLERIADTLDRIEDSLPSSNSVSTDYIETLLDRANDKTDQVINKMDDLNSNIVDLGHNMR